MLQLAWLEPDELDTLDSTVIYLRYIARPGSLWRGTGNCQQGSRVVAEHLLAGDGQADPIAQPYFNCYTHANRDAHPNSDAHATVTGVTWHPITGPATDYL